MCEAPGHTEATGAQRPIVNVPLGLSVTLVSALTRARNVGAVAELIGRIVTTDGR